MDTFPLLNEPLYYSGFGRPGCGGSLWLGVGELRRAGGRRKRLPGHLSDETKPISCKWFVCMWMGCGTGAWAGLKGNGRLSNFVEIFQAPAARIAIRVALCCKVLHGRRGPGGAGGRPGVLFSRLSKIGGARGNPGRAPCGEIWRAKPFRTTTITVHGDAWDHAESLSGCGRWLVCGGLGSFHVW
jgi:hypothetical protein